MITGNSGTSLALSMPGQCSISGALVGLAVTPDSLSAVGSISMIRIKPHLRTYFALAKLGFTILRVDVLEGVILK